MFYISTRIGQLGKPFKLYKFRTMVKNADKMGPSSTAGDDPRLTRIGKFLRKYKLDELPQLINILKRDMNLVGPRPDVPEMIDLLTLEEKKIILSVRPGLTDLASIWDSNEEERLAGASDPHKKYLEEIWPEKKRLQIYYIQNKSLWLDIKILVKTFLKVILRVPLRGESQTSTAQST